MEKQEQNQDITPDSNINMNEMSSSKYLDEYLRNERFNYIRRTVSYGCASHLDIENPRQFIDSSERTVELMGAFCEDYIPEQTYHAAILSNLSDILESADQTNGNKEIAKRAVAEYLGYDGFTIGEKAYALSILSDSYRIKKVARSIRKGITGKKSEEVKPLNEEDIAILAGHAKQEKISDELWRFDDFELNLGEKERIVHSSNMESVLILAAAAINDIANPSTKYDSELLYAVIEAEHFYAPLCEIWGFDAMAMTLRSQAYLCRLRKQNTLTNNQAIERAESIHQNAINFGGPERVMQQIFGADNIRVQYEMKNRVDHIPHDLAKFCDMDIMDGQFRVVGRVKSKGSLAKKMIEDPNYSDAGELPMDVIAATVITEDDFDVLADKFIYVLDQIHDLSQKGFVQTKAAASKKHPIHIQGSKEFRQTIASKLHDHPLAEIVEINPDEKPFQVARITYVTNLNAATEPVNVEIQFLTQFMRQDARIGATSHINYKTQGKDSTADEDSVQLIAEINRRKTMISRDHIGINEATTKHTAEFINRNNLGAEAVRIFLANYHS